MRVNVGTSENQGPVKGIAERPVTGPSMGEQDAKSDRDLSGGDGWFFVCGRGLCFAKYDREIDAYRLTGGRDSQGPVSGREERAK